MFLNKIETFFTDIIRIFLPDESNTSHAVSHPEFSFQKLRRVTFGLLDYCHYGKKWTGNKYFVKILLTGVKLQI